MFDRLAQTLAQVFDTDASAMAPEQSIRSLPNWDSLRHLKMIMAVETEFGIELEPEEIESLTTLADILGHLEA